jgi:hypothetical protein
MQRSETARYLYTAWFRDTCALPEDQDFEWPACFVVVATTEASAQIWGDHLSHSFSRRRITEVFLTSKVEPAPDGGGGLPVVEAGHEVSDGEIGW